MTKMSACKSLDDITYAMHLTLNTIRLIINCNHNFIYRDLNY